MLKLYDNGIYLVNGETICSCPEEVAQKTGRIVDAKEAEKGTMAYGILQAHNKSGDPDQLQLKFDSMTSHDITYVGIIQTARASGMKQFPLPYVLTNCHNSLCAVGGTINEDDHKFALSAAHKYGGIYVPTNMANIHSYNRETMAGGGKMILGPTPTPATVHWAPWRSARAAASWPSSCWAAPMTSLVRRSLPST